MQVLAFGLMLLATPALAANPLQGVVTYTDNDLASAISLANKATPPDTAAAGCFTSMRAILAQIGSGALPISLHLATDSERLWLLRQGLLGLKADTNCQALCSRFGQLAPLVSKVTPTLCDGLNLVR
jgi:hypothetical protein